MLDIITSICCLMFMKSIRPFLKQNIIPDISIEQFIIINTISVLLILLLYYNLIDNSFNNITTVYYNLDNKHKIIIFIISILTIFITYFETFIELSPIPTNSILLRLIGSVSTVLVVYFLNKEPLNRDLIAGYFFTLVGFFLIGNKIVRT